jgi:hypothetical protein
VVRHFDAGPGKDGPGKILLMVQKVNGAYQPTHAVTYQEDRFPGLPCLDHVVIGFDRIKEVLEAFNINPRSVRFTMPQVIESVNGITQRNEVVDHVHVPPAVFGKAVDDEQNGFGRGFGEPGLIVYSGIVRSLKKAFLVGHKGSF